MYEVKKSKSGYVFDLPRERVAFMFLKDGTYVMFHDEEFLCYSPKPVEISREELKRFEETGEMPELVRKLKAHDFPSECVVKRLPPIDEDLEPFNPNRKCVVVFTGFQDTVIDYLERDGITYAVARLVDEPKKVCRFVGKGNYKIAAVKLKRNEKCLSREEFIKELEKLKES